MHGDRIVLEAQEVDTTYVIKSSKSSLCTACNFFSRITYYFTIFLCYVKLKFVFNDIFRTGKTSFIVILKIPKPGED